MIMYKAICWFAIDRYCELKVLQLREHYEENQDWGYLWVIDE